jgi:hypothetical protein
VKLSAILSLLRRMPMRISCVLLLLLTTALAQAGPCGPSPAIRSQLEKSAVVVTDPADFDQALAPLAALRQHDPNNLWVNEHYQDAVQQYGIEGHVRKLTEEYQVLSMQHPDEVMYSYLYARSLMGRNTSAAVQQMAEIVAAHPDFAPAHGSLAEIYSSPNFRDEPKEKVERLRFLALCPQSELQQRPARLPDPSLLVDQAESLLAQNGDPDRIAAMAEQGIRGDEWRLQRIRPFDWYSVDYKRLTQRQLQAKYWRFWSLEVRCQRRAGRREKAAELLAKMDQRAALLHSSSDPVYWDALATLARLYAEGDQKDLATQRLNSMQGFLLAHPDPNRSAQIEALRKLADTGNK